MANQSIYINCDGGSRGNPGPAACAYVATHQGDMIFSSSGKYLGICTNNQAEYEGVLLALMWLKNYLERVSCSCHVTFRLDSLLVVKQLSGEYKIKDVKMLGLFQKADLIIQEIKHQFNYAHTITFVHIPRSQNSAADSLVNQTLDVNLTR